MRKLLTVTVIVLVVLTLVVTNRNVPATAAQGTPPSDSGAEMVFVPVVVLDSKKVAVKGLKAENFKLTEDGKDQKVEFISEPGIYGAHGVVLALTGNGPVKAAGSRDRLATSILSAFKLFKDAGTIAGSFSEEMPWDSDGVYGVVSRSLTKLDQVNDPRRALIVVSDGTISSGSRTASDSSGLALIDAAKKYKFPVYFMFIVSSRANEPALNSDTGTYSVGYTLQQIADATGGEVVPGQPDQDLDIFSAELRDKLKNRYILGFNSTNKAKEGKFRKLDVKVTPPAGVSGLKVSSSKKRYWVPKG